MLDQLLAHYQLLNQRIGQVRYNSLIILAENHRPWPEDSSGTTVDASITFLS